MRRAKNATAGADEDEVVVEGGVVVPASPGAANAEPPPKVMWGLLVSSELEGIILNLGTAIKPIRLITCRLVGSAAVRRTTKMDTVTNGKRKELRV